MRSLWFSSFISGVTLDSIAKRQKGLTLVELMIAITLGLIVLLAIGSIYLNSRQTYRVQEDNARLQEAGKYALEVLGRSIRQAGSNAEMKLNQISVTPQCNVAGTCVAISGTNGAGTAADAMTVAYYAGREEASGAAWIARNCTGGTASSASNDVITNAFAVVGTNLQCTGSVNGVAAVPQPLIENVVDFQIIYGIDTTVPANQTADLYVAAPTAAQWPLVVTARVCVGIQSGNNGLVAAPQRYLNCAGALGTASGAAAFTTAPAGDLRIHRSFVATYNLRNRVPGAP